MDQGNYLYFSKYIIFITLLITDCKRMWYVSILGLPSPPIISDGDDSPYRNETTVDELHTHKKTKLEQNKMGVTIVI